MKKHVHLFCVIFTLYISATLVSSCGNNNEPEKRPPTTTGVTAGITSESDTLN